MRRREVRRALPFDYLRPTPVVLRILERFPKPVKQSMNDYRVIQERFDGTINAGNRPESLFPGIT